MFQAQKNVETNWDVRKARNNQNFKRNGSSVIGSDLSINGDVESVGPLIINGKVKGDVKSRTLTVKEEGVIEGNVTSDNVTVFGKVFGTIHARELKLRPSSHVEGDIFHEQIEIEMGTNFSGKLTRTEFVQEANEKISESTLSDTKKEVDKSENTIQEKKTSESPLIKLAQDS